MSAYVSTVLKGGPLTVHFCDKCIRPRIHSNIRASFDWKRCLKRFCFPSNICTAIIIHIDTISSVIYIPPDISTILKRCSLSIYLRNKSIKLIRNAVKCQIRSYLYWKCRFRGSCTASHIRTAETVNCYVIPPFMFITTNISTILKRCSLCVQLSYKSVLLAT